jgi:hypothetical protein
VLNFHPHPPFLRKFLIQGAILLATENKSLQAANEGQIRKRLLQRRQISKAISLTIAQALQLIQVSQNSQDQPVYGGDREADLSHETAPEVAIPQITCYICRGYDYIASDYTKYRMNY